jgi:hypothetical protein
MQSCSWSRDLVMVNPTTGLPSDGHLPKPWLLNDSRRNVHESRCCVTDRQGIDGPMFGELEFTCLSSLQTSDKAVSQC